MFSSLLLLLLLVPLAAATNTNLFGTVNVQSQVYVASINTIDGTKTNLGQGALLEGQAQGLSCGLGNEIFIIGFNFTTSTANLLGFNIHDGSIQHDVTLPFAESGFVGVGQQLACDVSDLIVVGHDKVNGSLIHHVLSFNPTTKEMTSIVKISGSHIGILGSTSTMDTKRGVFYTSFATNKSGTIDINMYAISTRKGNTDYGQYIIVPTNPSIGHSFGPMKYDVTLDSIIGFSRNPTTKARNILQMEATSLQQQQQQETKRTWKAIGDVVGYEMEDGNIIAINGKQNILYAILQPTPTGPQTYVNESNCAPSCATNTFCCRDPTQPDDDGSCYTVPCERIPTGSSGVNMTEPFRLVAFNLKENAKVIGVPPSLCTLAANDCPWQMDVMNE